MKILDDVLEFLQDGQWHSLYSIQEITGLSTFKTKLLANFLISYGFCDYKSGTATTPPCPITALKLKDNVKHFFEQLNKLETNVRDLQNV